MLKSAHSFRLLSGKNEITDIRPALKSEKKVSNVKTEDTSESDSKKRSFLKLAGVVGVGAIAVSLLPKKAEALVFGSNPTATSTGVKNASGTRINPATEETLATVQASTTAIESSTASIKTNTDRIPSLGQAVMANSTPVVIASDQSPIAISGSMSFDASSRMTVDASDSLFYLRKIVKQLEPLTTVDSSNRQRVIIDSSSALTVTLSANTVTTIAGQGTQMFQDVARNTFANGIRNNLAFS